MAISGVKGYLDKGKQGLKGPNAGEISLNIVQKGRTRNLPKIYQKWRKGGPKGT